MNGRRVAVVALVAAGLLGAACSSDDKDAATTASVVGSTTVASGPGTTVASATTVGGPRTTVASATTGGLPTTAPPTAPAGSTPAATFTKLADVAAPTGIAVRPGDDRLFVVGRGGTVVPVGADGTVGTPVLDIADLIVAGGEQGLLGLAFHPTEPLAYVDYTGTDGGNTHIAEFAVAADGTMDPASRREVLEIDQPFANHNGGQLAFGPDGNLYIGMGDGGSGGDPDRRALNLNDLLGKILRIDPRASGGKPYTVPADNPFVGTDGARPEIWIYGVRNPWRFSFDPSTGDLWIADVGQGDWEEIDVGWAAEGGGRGVNLGWSAWEGTLRFNRDQKTKDEVPPFFEYQHGDAGCSISGGARYRGAAIPALDGWYVYGDYCAGEVRGLSVDGEAAGPEVVLGKVGAISSVAAGPTGELYVTSVDGNAVYAVTPSNP